VGEIPMAATRTAFENEIGVLLKDLTPQRIDANLARITAIHRGDTYMFGEENKSAGIAQFIANLERPRPERVSAQPKITAAKAVSEENPAKLYYRYIRQYFERKYESDPDCKRIVDGMIEHIHQGDRVMPGVMRASIQTRASDSGKSVARWVENDSSVCLLGIVCESGRLPREDAAFAREMVDHFADALAAGKTLRTMPNENSRPLLGTLESALRERGLEMRSMNLPPQPLFGRETGTPCEITAVGLRDRLRARESRAQPGRGA
jgi:hypothetical protein